MRATLLRLELPRRPRITLEPAPVRHVRPDVPWSPMPYGAPELKRVARDYLTLATFVACVSACAVFAVSYAAKTLLTHPVVERSVVIVPYRELAAPPPLNQSDAPPPVAITTAVAQPSIGIAVPVPDAQAPPEQTIASQQEIAALTPMAAAPSPGDEIIVQPPADEELPKFGEYVYAEELPEAITRVAPVYPDVARDASVDGTVMVQALVGRDGRVKDTRVVQSVPMLDHAAVEAVRQWVFKPALSNNRPVAVWVAIPVRFTLQGR
jgi:protein TonB